MIWESYYWKTPLLRMARRLRALKTAGELSEKQLVQIERDIFIGFYSIRKLFETFGVMTDAARSLQVRVLWHPNRKRPDALNSHRLAELYDFEQEERTAKNIRFVANLIIHSFIFSPCVNDGGLEGIFLTSDKERSKRLYFMAIDDVIAAFERVGKDYVTELQTRRDPETGDLTVTKAS